MMVDSFPSESSRTKLTISLSGYKNKYPVVSRSQEDFKHRRGLDEDDDDRPSHSAFFDKDDSDIPNFSHYRRDDTLSHPNTKPDLPTYPEFLRFFSNTSEYTPPLGTGDVKIKITDHFSTEESVPVEAKDSVEETKLLRKVVGWRLAGKPEPILPILQDPSDSGDWETEFNGDCAYSSRPVPERQPQGTNGNPPSRSIVKYLRKHLSNIFVKEDKQKMEMEYYV